MVCGFYCCMGFLALIIKMTIKKNMIDNRERGILVGSAILTVIGLALQLKVINNRNIYICLFGFIVSYTAITIMDGALLGLISQFAPAEFMSQNGFINISFVHVLIGSLGRCLGCISVYLPYLLNIYRRTDSIKDLQKSQ